MAVSRAITIGTRKSQLALWQTHHISALLQRYHPGLVVSLREFSTTGDRNLALALPEIGGKGVFTAELEQALLDGEIDLAVHSLKDLPTAFDPRFVLGAVCERESVRDVLVSRDDRLLSELPAGALVGTSSLRRESQIRRLRPDLTFRPIRGNVETRIRKVKGEQPEYDATVLAEAGVKRLKLEKEASYVFGFDEILPAPGQGALAVQCLASAGAVRELISSIDSPRARLETAAERGFLNQLDAGCSTPIGALALYDGVALSLSTRALSPDGVKMIELREKIVVKLDNVAAAESFGRSLADKTLARGFSDLGIGVKPGMEHKAPSGTA